MPANELNDDRWERPPPRPRFAVYPLVGDQIQFSEELHSGDDKVAATLAARRGAKAHPLGVILIEHKTFDCWVWREHPPLKGHPVRIEVNMEDVERWFKDWAPRYLARHRQ